MNQNGNAALRASRVGVFAGLYAVTSLVPISVFVGAQSMLSLNLIITPCIAILLSPIEAGVAALIGGLLALWIAPWQAMFGPTTVLLPLAGAFLGSMISHKKKMGFLLATIFLTTTILSYLTSRPEFPYWTLPHMLALISAGVSTFFTPWKIRISLIAFVATMCEQAAMLVQAVYVLQLPYIVFMTAFPLMLYERAIGTIGGFLIAFGLSRLLPNFESYFIEQSVRE
jgi:hypothetical protein